MDWYKQAFGPLYSDLYSHRDENDARRAVDFLERHADLDPSGGRVLDLCCGAGRHSIQWMGRFGGMVTGLDLSESLLAQAGEAARTAGLRFPLVRGDMRHLPYRDGSVALVLNLFTSFGYFEKAGENERVFSEVSRVLAPREVHFVFDHINPPYLRATLRPETVRTTAAGLEVREVRRIDETSRRVEKTIEILNRPELGRFVESVRFYDPDEIGAMARRHGLLLEAAYGGYDDSPLTAESPRALYVFHR